MEVTLIGKRKVKTENNYIYIYIYKKLKVKGQFSVNSVRHVL
jgi:hypothetical protein